MHNSKNFEQQIAESKNFEKPIGLLRDEKADAYALHDLVHLEPDFREFQDQLWKVVSDCCASADTWGEAVESLAETLGCRPCDIDPNLDEEVYDATDEEELFDAKRDGYFS